MGSPKGMDFTEDLIKQVTEKCLEYSRRPYYQEQLQVMLLQPVLDYLGGRIYPYFLGVVLLLIINILCMVIAMYLFRKA